MMNKFIATLCLGLCLLLNVAHAEVVWVGDSAACDAQARTAPTLTLALVQTAFNGDSSNEIRLTAANTNYIGAANHAGFYTIGNRTDSLIIKGGYSDCGVAPSNRTEIGHATSPVFTVDNSTVTFMNITMRLSGSRGLVADNDATVYLDNVVVFGNQSGVEVKGGAYVELKANSVVQSNSDPGTAKGGGIYCHESSSMVIIGGRLHENAAVKGGNLFVETGCSAELGQKSFITNGTASDAGGGILVDNGGQLWARGGAEVVRIQGNTAVNGGGIFVWGTGRVILNNTTLDGNSASDKGAAIFAANGGGVATQVTMDRVDDCPFLISCSVITGHDFYQSLVYLYNSRAQISRTVVDSNNFTGPYDYTSSLFYADTSSILHLNRVAMTRNETWYLLSASGDGPAQVFATHITAARNQFHKPGYGELGSFPWVNFGIMNIQNSIFDDTHGSDPRVGNFSGDCNLIDDSKNWPAGTYVIGTPQFINVDGGDMRQVASSPGVDMCNQDDFAWSTEKDIENQDAPVNENTNQQGHPGQAGGLYDAGVDEVYDNIGEDMFLLTVQKVGSGSGSVASSPVGIACGSDCTEVYFRGTVVTLYPFPSADSEFVGWQHPPLSR
ncbi:MAG TPA: right-handed parallel beta-helix repeat-containing protein [Dokdonella sp.]|uniref:right-handed parallel beta-helix repeat-containing protein n=1 Tax=Dokdonella sp. TaxID=2291710 RepID=UPI002D7F7B4A|nr:right-handed parallel beta-helix repeat-containing protein [Dokdonella sp.]HET9032821.1 right-handed parallel beta-helix repeat-containing protein [Dokdonella sp.]